MMTLYPHKYVFTLSTQHDREKSLESVACRVYKWLSINWNLTIHMQNHASNEMSDIVNPSPNNTFVFYMDYNEHKK